MKNKINTGVRILFGIGLVMVGSDKFLEFIPHSHEMTESLVNAFMGLVANKFILPTVGIVEILVGISLLLNKFTNFSLLAMLPVSYGIVAFHLAVDVSGVAVGVIVVLLNAYLLLQKKEELMVLLKP